MGMTLLNKTQCNQLSSSFSSPSSNLKSSRNQKVKGLLSEESPLLCAAQWMVDVVLTTMTNLVEILRVALSGVIAVWANLTATFRMELANKDMVSALIIQPVLKFLVKHRK